eukprot:4613189-Prymnesium_polylepis.2
MRERVRASLRVALGVDGAERRSVSPMLLLPIYRERRVPVTASRNLGAGLLAPIGGRLRLDQRGRGRERGREEPTRLRIWRKLGLETARNGRSRERRDSRVAHRVVVVGCTRARAR